jgi:hypothetical protein
MSRRHSFVRRMIAIVQSLIELYGQAPLSQLPNTTLELAYSSQGFGLSKPCHDSMRLGCLAALPPLIEKMGATLPATASLQFLLQHLLLHLL